MLKLVFLILVIYFKNANSAMEPEFKLVSKSFNHLKPNLTIPFMVMLGGFIFPLGDQCVLSSQLALDLIAERNVLKNYNLIVDMFDEKCNAPMAVRMSMEIIEQAKSSYSDMPPLLIGSGCFGGLKVGHFIKHFNFVNVHEHVPNIEIVNERSMFSNAFLLSESLSSIYGGVPHFIHANGWNRVFLLSDSLPLWFPVSC